MVAEADPELAIDLCVALAKIKLGRGLAVAKALVILPNINAVNLYQTLSNALPEHSVKLKAALVSVKPELADELAKVTPTNLS
jgi:hypothetical protein